MTTRALQRVAIVIAVLLAIYAAAGFLLLPWVIERNGATFLERRLERSVTIGDARINPFLLTMDVRDVRIAGGVEEGVAAATVATDRATNGADEIPVLAFDRLHVDLALSGLFRRTWTIAALSVDGLRAHIVLNRDGRLNVVELARRLVGTPADPPRDTAPSIMLHQVEFRAASLRFTELGPGTPASLVIAPLDLTATGLTTMNEGRGKHSVTATLPDGGSLEWHGELALRPKVSSTGTLQLRGLQASAVWPFLRDRLQIDELQASADLTARYTYDPADSLQLEALALAVTGLRMARKNDDDPLLVLERIEATGGHVDFARRSAMLERFTASRGVASAALNAQGDHNWALLAAAAETSPDAQSGSVTAPGWTIQVDRARLDHIGLQFVDRSRAQALAVDVGSITAASQIALTTGTAGQFKASGIDVRIEDAVVRAADATAPAARVASLGLEEGLFDLQARRLAAQRIYIAKGQATVVRELDGTIALLDLLGTVAGAPAKVSTPAARAAAGAAPPWRYDIAAVDIEAIALVVGDRTFVPAVNYDLLVESIAVKTLTSRVDTDIEFNARVNVKQGGSAVATGTYTTGSQAVKSRIEVDRLALGPLQPVARRYSGLSIQAGLLSLAANVRHMPAAEALNLQVDDLSLTLTQLAVASPRDERAMLALQRIEGSGGTMDLARRTVLLQGLVLEKGQVRARVNRDGRLDWQAARPAPMSGPATSPAEGSKRARPARAPAAPAVGSAPRDAPPWDVRVASLRLNEVAAHYTDHSREPPVAVDINRLDASLAVRMKAGGERMEFVADRLALKAQQITAGAPDPAPPAIALKSASIAEGRVDLGALRVGAAQVVLQFDDMRLVRQSDGRLTLIDLLLPARAAREAPRAAQAEERRWQYDLQTLRVEPFTIAVTDEGFAPPLSFTGTLQADATNIATDRRLAFAAALSLAPGGSLEVDGDADAGFSDLQARVTIDRMALVPLQPLLARFAALDLRSGVLSANAKLRYGSGEPTLLEVDGGLRINDLLMNESLSGERLLSWRQLDAGGVRFDHATGALSVSTVTVDEPGAKIAISEKRTVNLAQLIRRDTQTMSPDTDVAPAQATPRGAAQSPPFAFRIDRVLLRSGVVDYADRSLVLPFATTVTAFNGTISGISNDRQRRADVKANGSIPPYGSASVEGSIVPFAPRTFTDLRVRFNNVQVPPLSPYTATFAGRTVESGRLWLDLAYRIDDGELLGNNDIRLSDFTLGKRVAAPGAADLPLDLAVALLTDSKGEIKLSVPVRGDLDSPRFSVAGAIGQALGNVLQRVVSAPFRALASLLGSGASGESLASIDFRPGSTVLRPEQREKLDLLVRALNERPQLQLVVTAPYDPQVDTRALQIELAARALAQVLGHEGDARDDVGPIAYDDPKTRKALERLLSEQAGPAAARTLTAGPGDGNNDSRQRYQALFERLAETYAVGPDKLRLLAAGRAQAIAAHLATQGMSPRRVRTGNIAAVSESREDAIGARLAVDVAKPAS